MRPPCSTSKKSLRVRSHLSWDPCVSTSGSREPRQHQSGACAIVTPRVGDRSAVPTAPAETWSLRTHLYQSANNNSRPQEQQRTHHAHTASTSAKLVACGEARAARATTKVTLCCACAGGVVQHRDTLTKLPNIFPSKDRWDVIAYRASPSRDHRGRP